jgi:hypothetical protein
MNKLKVSQLMSIVAAMSSIGASISLEQAGVAVGIFTALVTCTVNALCTMRRDRREERMLEARLKAGLVDKGE